MVPLAALSFLGSGLQRPECALAHASGLLFAPDWAGNGGIAVIAPSGRVTKIEARWPEPLRPNGIALEPGGTFVLAHLGAEAGGLFRMDCEGNVEPVLTELEGRPLPPSNFPLLDGEGRIWLTVSTTIVPRAADYRKGAKTGFIVLIEKGRARIVADGLGYANECAVTEGGTLLVNETFARRTAAFDLSKGALTNRRTIAAYGPGTYPDGLALDAEGGFAITSIVSNRVIRVAPSGEQETWLEDADPEHVAWAEAAWEADELGRPHLDKAAGRLLRNVSNLAFAGEGLDKAVLGCLLGDRLATFESPVPGLAPAHWRAELGPLARFIGEERA